LITDEFEFEKKVRIWSKQFYENKGFEVKEITGSANRKSDLILIFNNNEYRVEEKARRKYYPDLCFELVQCVVDKKWGWIYDINCDWIIYIFWNINNSLPQIIYKIIWKECKKYCLNNLEKYKLKISRKGYGLTIFATIPWTHLEQNNIAKIIYKSERQT